MRALISFFFLIIIVSNVETASAETGLLHWTRADRAIPWRQTSVNASKPWKLCALYPSLKDSYWLSVNYGMQKAAKLYGVDLKVLEANGYRQLATQQQQMTQCREWGADAILLGSSTIRFPELERYAGNVPVIEVANVIRDASVATHVGLPWFQMGYLPGRFLVQWSKEKRLTFYSSRGRRKLAAVRRWWRVFVRQLKAAPSTLWISPGAITTLKCSETYSRKCWSVIRTPMWSPGRR